LCEDRLQTFLPVVYEVLFISQTWQQSETWRFGLV